MDMRVIPAPQDVASVEVLLCAVLAACSVQMVFRIGRVSKRPSLRQMRTMGMVYLAV